MSKRLRALMLPQALSFCLEAELSERDAKLGKPFYMPKYYYLALKHILGKMLQDKIGVAECREIELSSNDDTTVRGKNIAKH